MKQIIRDGAEIKDREMRTLHVDNHDLLLIRKGNDFYLMGAHCPHYGAPLETGVLNGNRLVCPWHNSCFNIKTGELEEPPSLHSLNKVDVEIQGKDLLVRIPDNYSENILPKMVSKDLIIDNRNFVIIGAGAAGLAAAQVLRESGYKGNIKMITSEPDHPYDRPNLSKAYLSGQAPDDWMPLHPPKFYSTYNIDIQFNDTVVDLNRVDKCITLNTGEIIDYDKLLIATGANPIKIDVPGAELGYVHYLRSYQSCKAIINEAEKAENIAVIGASFIGTETAFSIAERTKKKVKLITHSRLPFEKTFGREIGSLILRKHQEYGTEVYLNSEIERFEGDTSIRQIHLKDGSVIPADMVIVGIGVIPATDFLHDFDLLSDRSVETDKTFKAFDSIYVAGDAATFIDSRTNRPVRIEHWRTAQQQGRIAGLNMLGDTNEYTGTPFFWTKQVGINIKYIGYTYGWDEIIFDGDVNSEKFVAYYIKDNKIAACAGNKRDKDIAALSELMRTNSLPLVDELRKGGFRPTEILSKKEYA